MESVSLSSSVFIMESVSLPSSVFISSSIDPTSSSSLLFELYTEFVSSIINISISSIG